MKSKRVILAVARRAQAVAGVAAPDYRFGAERGRSASIWADGRWFGLVGSSPSEELLQSIALHLCSNSL